MKHIFLGLVVSLVFLNAANASEEQLALMPIVESNGMTVKHPAKITSANLVGGWYPVFFDSYSEQKIQDLISQISNNRVSKIIITCDENSSLGRQILSEIQLKTNFAVKMDYLSGFDTPIKYNHNRVIVTVYSKVTNITKLENI